MLVAKKLVDQLTDIFNSYSEAFYRTKDAFRLLLSYKVESGYGLGYFSALPYPFEYRVPRC